MSPDQRRARFDFSDRARGGPSLAELQFALRIAAQAVALVGEPVLPIYLRIEEEIAGRSGTTAALARAAALAAEAPGEAPGARSYKAMRASASARASSPPPSP